MKWSVGTTGFWDGGTGWEVACEQPESATEQYRINAAPKIAVRFAT